MYFNYLLLIPILTVLTVCKTESVSMNNSNCDKSRYSKILGSCCNIPRNDKISKSCRKSLLSQKKTTTNNGENRNLKSDKVALHACIAECVFKENGFLLANGTVSLPTMQRSYEQRYRNDPTLSQLMVRSLKSCVDYAQDRTKQYEWLHAKDNCDYFPATLLACTMEQVYINCPSTKWNNTENCVSMRKYLSTCS